jgi:hypothetical protein
VEEGRTCTSLGRRHVKRMERGHGAQRAIVAGGEKEEGSGAGGATCRGGGVGGPSPARHVAWWKDGSGAGSGAGAAGVGGSQRRGTRAGERPG